MSETNNKVNVWLSIFQLITLGVQLFCLGVTVGALLR
jgi:hypothetical protein